MQAPVGQPGHTCCLARRPFPKGCVLCAFPQWGTHLDLSPPLLHGFSQILWALLVAEISTTFSIVTKLSQKVQKFFEEDGWLEDHLSVSPKIIICVDG